MQMRSALVLVLLFFGVLRAQNLTVEIIGGGLKRHAISLLNFQNQNLLDPDFQDVIKHDLSMTGLFNFVDSSEAIYEPEQINDSLSWISRGIMSINMGSVRRLSGDNLEVKVALFDLSQSKSYFNRLFTIRSSQSRQLAHLISDLIYEAITGIKGVFSTKIIYVFKPLNTDRGRYQLQVADIDGTNQQTILRSNEPIISPAWSPDGRKVAYVSFENRKPVVYLHDLATGNRQVASNFKGSNSSPAFSPDGTKLSVTLTRNENSQIFFLNLGSLSSPPQSLIKSNGIDTEGVFSPDGRYFYFTSDRVGSPQIYRFELSTGKTERVTYEGNYNVTPAVSVNGDLAFIRSQGGNFKLMIKRKGDVAVSYTSGSDDESPSWSANGQMILYSTKERGRSLLKIITVDGSTTTTLKTPLGEIDSPEFSPFIGP